MERRALTVRGIVQGVGFRPFVHRVASGLRLSGFVRNDSGGVAIEIEGDPRSLDLFCRELTTSAPPLARIDDVAFQRITPLGDGEFRIVSSTGERHGLSTPPAPVAISPDVATCDACLSELFDPDNRRAGHSFINCTDCGPRLTIVTAAPYDRQRTSMAAFAMCDACRRECDDPSDRRFHAQPIACPDCGPRLAVSRADGGPIASDDPLGEFARAILDGRIGALKGLGGYHFVCDAGRADVVRELRRRKEREEKPFAVIVSDIDAARRLCRVNTEEAELLESPRRPIVLLLRRRLPVESAESPVDPIAPEVAPGNPFLGVMLPYTPLHHLLMRAVSGRPLVMTSGNRSDEPIASTESDAFERLGGIADVFLTHDRPIHVRCDDSVTRVVAGVETPIRRSRGDAPRPIPLPVACARPLLAVGGKLKATFALGRDRRAIPSHHLGDLDHFDAFRSFERDVALYEQLFQVRPELLVHDLHPDYASTRYALRRAADEGLPTLAVQHHHAHVAACMAEHGLRRPVIGVALDGTGFGTDGAVWGGEFLIADYRGFRRAAHLRSVGLPGNERAIREPWRMAASHLLDAGCTWDAIAEAASTAALRTVRMMIERRLNTPATSSAGRLFDAVAAIAGVRTHTSFEGQAAMELEWLASEVPADGVYPFDVASGETPDAPLVVDTRPLIRELEEDRSRGIDRRRIARRFHSTLAEIIIEVCRRLRPRVGGQEDDPRAVVALSGGVFLNALLVVELVERLESEGFRVCRHRVVPTNDGGISLGQVAVAAAMTSQEQGS